MNEMFKLQIERTVCDTGLLSEQECLTTQQKLGNSYGSNITFQAYFQVFGRKTAAR